MQRVSEGLALNVKSIRRTKYGCKEYEGLALNMTSMRGASFECEEYQRDWL